MGHRVAVVNFSSLFFMYQIVPNVVLGYLKKKCTGYLSSKNSWLKESFCLVYILFLAASPARMHLVSCRLPDKYLAGGALRHILDGSIVLRRGALAGGLAKLKLVNDVDEQNGMSTIAAGLREKAPRRVMKSQPLRLSHKGRREDDARFIHPFLSLLPSVAGVPLLP